MPMLRRCLLIGSLVCVHRLLACQVLKRLRCAGKTIVARLFAKILHEIGMRKTANVVETTGQLLVQNGAIKADDTIKNAMDGVLFIDEAHSLDPKSNKAEGGAIVTKLLKAAEDQRDRITIILAG